jgi:HEAT repeat protein
MLATPSAIALAATVALASLLAPTLAQAQPQAAATGAAAPKPKAKPAAALDAPKAIPLPADTLKRLKSGDPASIQTALDDVRTSGRAGAPAVSAIAELLRQGLSPSLTKTAIETLADTENEAASETLAWYARNRSFDVRRTAVQALAKTRGAAATKALRAALSDPDAGVRGLSATGLGSMKAKDAVAELFVALEHKVPEAAASIGLLCAGAECDRLAGKLGSLPFDVVTSGLDEMLFRPQADVNDDLKVKIVGRVRELGTAEANRFLREVQTKWPASWSQRVKQSIDQAVLATAASPASASAPAPAGEP